MKDKQVATYRTSDMPDPKLELPVFAAARELIGLTYRQILKLYPEARTMQINKGMLIEVRFGNHTQDCLIGKDGRCRLCSIFFDTPDCVAAYLKLCRKKYRIAEGQWLYGFAQIDYFEPCDCDGAPFFTVTRVNCWNPHLSTAN